MKYGIKPVPSFLKELKRLSKRYVSIKEDVLALGRSLQMNPNQGVDLGRGLRKIRMVITSKGARQEWRGTGHHIHADSCAGRGRSGTSLHL